MIVLLTGIGYCTAALYPFFRDLLQIVNIVMQVIFWLTPIVWISTSCPRRSAGSWC